MTTCGNCNECCTGFDIPELRKPKGVVCFYLKGERCSIYDDRPKTCRDFECAFLSLQLNKKLRPDRSGFIIGLQNHKIHGPVYVCYLMSEVSKLAKKLIRRIRAKNHPDRKILWASFNKILRIE